MNCASAQVCVASTCIDETCVSVTCPSGQTCAKGSCYATMCGSVSCPAGQVCNDDACVDAACLGVICPSGQTCSAGACSGVCGDSTCVAGMACDPDTLTCVDPSCVGVHCDAGTCSNGACPAALCGGTTSCDGGTGLRLRRGPVRDARLRRCALHRRWRVCSAGACVDQCSLTCAAPCPQCDDGRSCQVDFECTSHFCQSNVCADCDDNTNNCPNGGICQTGVCRSDVDGPCLSNFDCRPGHNLTCENGQCRYTSGATCASDMQCITSLRCVDLVCQPPKCILAEYGSTTVPNLIFEWEAVSGSSPNEVYVTYNQWNGNYANSNFRRYRAFIDGGYTEQDPTMPTAAVVRRQRPDSERACRHAGQRPELVLRTRVHLVPGWRRVRRPQDADDSVLGLRR